MQRDRRFWLAAVLLFVVIFANAGCSARSSEQPPAAEQVESAKPVAAEPAAAPQADNDDDFTDNCHGILSCTFFGLGAVIAAPFWVLGAVLGLVF